MAGMAQGWSKNFYKSKKWQKCRGAYIDKRRMIDGGMCEVCGLQLGYIVHHKIMLDETNIKNPEIALNCDLLEYVCKDCHDKYEGHGVGNSAEALVLFDDSGMPIARTHTPPLNKTMVCFAGTEEGSFV